MSENTDDFQRPADADGDARKPAWGEGLAYPEQILRMMPAMHGAFNALNRYVSVPMLRAGLGRYMSNPVTGYLMILRTRGRRSGEMRDAPLGYAVLGDAVYCLAGFGTRTNWYQNLLADPRVEVILPTRSFTGLAEDVTDRAEQLAMLPPLLRSMGPLTETFGLGNPMRETPEELVRKCEGMPLVRVRPTGIASGPDDPGGWFWVVPACASVLGGLWLLRRVARRKR
jgi:deazaflavin-dependent oxidoreductase (nitroreductase family)